MAGINNEIGQKLRADIKTKLTDIGAYVDNELPDYIMVMVANQRTKYQMKDDLSLFLGKNTDEFVDWLYEVLKNIQSNSVSGVASSSERKSKKDGSLDGDPSEGKKEKVKKEKKRTKKQVAEDKKMNQMASVNEVTISNTLKSKKQGKDEEASGNDNEDDFQQKEINLINKNDDTAICEQDQTDQEVFLALKSDNDNDELLLETQEESKTTTEAPMPRRSLRRPLKERLQILAKSKGAESGGNMPVSTIGAVLKRNNQQPKVEEEDDIKLMGKNNVTSIVKVAERKSSVPPAMQASSLLVLKAVQGAHKSVSQTSNQLKRKSSETDSVPAYKKSRLTDQSVNLKDLDPCDLRHCLEANRAQKDQLNENRYLDNRDSENETSTRQSPRFIVTVGGTAKLNKDMNNRLGVRAENQAEDELLLDEEIEEEFREDNLDTEDRSETMTEDNDVPAKINERCKYWPSCKNGTLCLYHHPTSQCRTYPNCKFGDKCLFIHPSSNYPFKNSGLSNPRIAPTTCRYFPNCFNINCPFLHPKLCNFGLNCRNASCPFTHPTGAQTTNKNLPKPHQLKWKNTDKKFAFEGKPESMPVTIEKASST